MIYIYARTYFFYSVVSFLGPKFITIFGLQNERTQDTLYANLISVYERIYTQVIRLLSLRFENLNSNVTNVTSKYFFAKNRLSKKILY